MFFLDGYCFNYLHTIVSVIASVSTEQQTEEFSVHVCSCAVNEENLREDDSVIDSAVTAVLTENSKYN